MAAQTWYSMLRPCVACSAWARLRALRASARLESSIKVGSVTQGALGAVLRMGATAWSNARAQQLCTTR
eukprot:6692854-Lingulodinium_polyedra.AAC.1